MPQRLYEWNDISGQFTHSLILGNGASIALDERFRYLSLRETAERLGLLTAPLHRIFDHLHTEDFELVLRILWHAQQINEALDIPDTRTEAAYNDIRCALIQSVQAIHVPYDEVEDRLQIAADFLARFSTVISLNYDLIVYWTMMIGNDKEPRRFKDCFVGREFQHDWCRFREALSPATASTLIFYPHGNLVLGADIAGVERKIHRGAGSVLLDTVIEQWRSASITPVFVSEGTSDQKLRAIHRSRYLTTVLQEVMPDLGESVVIYGWSMSEQDVHLLRAMGQSEVQRIAISVNPEATDLEATYATVGRRVRDVFRRESLELFFFNRLGADCWITPVGGSA